MRDLWAKREIGHVTAAGGGGGGVKLAVAGGGGARLVTLTAAVEAA
eukprot:COSAG06_NODE_2362_length_7003_cov_15.069815_2_plen_46_part_00